MTKKVGVAIIGTGFARRVQIPLFLECDGAEVVSVASGSIENARSAAEEFKIRHFTDDWRESVERPDAELVCVTTPPSLHREMTLFALERGKHVLCEKPMAMNVAEAEEMTAAAGKSGRLALIDHELRFQPGRQMAYAMLRRGEIGKVRHVKYNFRASSRGDINLRWNWWSDSREGGGALGAIGSHVIDSFNWFLGAGISGVSCQLQTHVRERRDSAGKIREVTTDDEANMLLKFSDSELTENATGLVSLSMVEQPGYLNRIEFFGTDGSIRVDQRGEVYLAKTGEAEWRDMKAPITNLLKGVPDSGFSLGFAEFAPVIIKAIAEGKTSIGQAATFEDGVKVQRVLDAARRSDGEGRAVSLGVGARTH